MSSTAFRDIWLRARMDILYFCQVMNFKPWSQQREILLAIQALTLAGAGEYKIRSFLAKSGQGTGKTALITIAALWRHMRVKGALSLIVAPTEKQAKSVFFAEMQRTLNRAPQFIRDLCTVTATQLIFDNDPTWKMVGVTASTPESAAGFHHPHMSVWLEEISGIQDPILEAFYGTCSQEHNLLGGIGNPTRNDGSLYDGFAMSEQDAQIVWPYRFTLSKLQLAKERPDLASMGKIDAARVQYGEDSDYWRVRILGQFPNSSGESILSRTSLERATQVPTWLGVTEAPHEHIKTVGIDFSGAGMSGDENAIYFRQGNGIVHHYAMYGDPYQAVEYAFDWQQTLGWKDNEVTYVPDAVGVGQGMLHFFGKHGKRYIPYGSNYKGDREHFNMETRAWFRCKEVMEQQVASMPDDSKLMNQLVARFWSFASDNRVLAESKKNYRKRTKRSSPDRADAFVQCFAADHHLINPGQAI